MLNLHVIFIKVRYFLSRLFKDNRRKLIMKARMIMIMINTYFKWIVEEKYTWRNALMYMYHTLVCLCKSDTKIDMHEPNGFTLIKKMTLKTMFLSFFIDILTTNVLLNICYVLCQINWHNSQQYQGQLQTI